MTRKGPLKMDAENIKRRAYYIKYFSNPENRKRVRERANELQRKRYVRKPKKELSQTYGAIYMREYNRTHRETNPHRTKKVGAAQTYAVTYTKLGPQCELCPPEDARPAACRHHMDYDYPLIFVSVCRSCHRYVHQSQVEVT